MQVNPRQDDDRKRPFLFAPEDIFEKRQQPGARERATIEPEIVTGKFLMVVDESFFDVVGVNEAIINNLNEKYLPLRINGVDDKEGYRAVHEGRMVYKKLRVSAEKYGKEKRADALRYQKAVIARENQLIALMEIGESHLVAEEKVVDDVLEAIKAEAEAKEAARIQVRIDAICAFGAIFNGQMYAAYGFQIPSALVRVCTDEQFAQFIARVQEKKDAEEMHIAREVAERREKAEALIKIAVDQETERQRLLSIAAELEITAREIDARIKREQEEKQKAIDDARRAEELEKARKEGAEKARIEAEEFARQNALKLAEAEQLAKSAAEKKMARRPDKIKLLAFVDSIENLIFPKMKTSEAATIILLFENELTRIVKILQDRAEGL